MDTGHDRRPCHTLDAQSGHAPGPHGEEVVQRDVGRVHEDGGQHVESRLATGIQDGRIRESEGLDEEHGSDETQEVGGVGIALGREPHPNAYLFVDDEENGRGRDTHGRVQNEHGEEGAARPFGMPSAEELRRDARPALGEGLEDHVADAEHGQERAHGPRGVVRDPR